MEKLLLLYDDYILSIINDYNNAIKEALYRKLGAHNLTEILLLTNQNDNISNGNAREFFSLNYAYKVIYNKSRLTNIKNALEDKYNKLNKYDKIFSIYPYINNNIFEGMHAILTKQQVSGYSVLQIGIVKFDENEDCDFNNISYDDIVDVFYYLYSNSFPVTTMSNFVSTTTNVINHTTLPIIPYLPLLYGIEYNNKLYKSLLSLETINADITCDKEHNNIVNLSRNNFDSYQVTMNEPIDILFTGINNSIKIMEECLMSSHEKNKYKNINIAGSNNTYYKYFDHYYPIVYDNLREDIINNRLSFEDLDCNLKYFEKFYDKYRQIQLMDFGCFYEEIYKFAIDITYMCMMIEYNDHKIRYEIENYLTNCAMNSINPLLKEFIEVDEEDYNIEFMVKIKLDDGNSARGNYISNNNVIPAKISSVTSNINIISITCYLLNDWFCNDIYNKDSISHSRTISNVIAITLARDKNTDKFLTLDQLLKLDPHNNNRAILYKKFFANRNFFDTNSIYFNNTIEENINIANYIKSIMYKHIKKENIIGIANKIYDNILKDISETLHNIIGNDIHAYTFEDLLIQLYYYTNIDTNIILNYKKKKRIYDTSKRTVY